jgi:hypothetical protein
MQASLPVKSSEQLALAEKLGVKLQVRLRTTDDLNAKKLQSSDDLELYS